MANLDVDNSAGLSTEDRSKPPTDEHSPLGWAKANLFNNAMNSVITCLLGVLLIIVALKGIGWLIDEEWQIVRDNLRIFMVGQFPKDDLPRLWISGFVLIGSVSVGVAALAHTAYDDAVEKDLPAERSSWADLLRRFWPLLAFVALIVSFVRTWPPVLGVLLALALLVGGRYVGWGLPKAIRSRGMYILAIGVIGAHAVLAGTGGLVAVVSGLVVALIVGAELGRRVEGGDIGSRITRLAVPVASGIAAWFILKTIGIEGFGWEDWGGIHLTLFVTVVGVTTGMPLGILLAVGRRSQLPFIKGFCVVFIEFVRGVPLISLLLFSNFILPLLFPVEVDTPETLTSAMIVITLFSAAYIAEIVRGGLQAVPKGQTEAAQASGMSAGKIQRLIVMPQALRAVIPSMVGQFISLFKDTSLLATVGVAEFFQVSSIANTQPDFLGKGLQLVTYSFVAIGYWAVAYTMSKESRRLEQKLGVGVR